MVGSTKMESWGFWNWDVKEKSALGDEEQMGVVSLKQLSKFLLCNKDSDSNFWNNPCYGDVALKQHLNLFISYFS